MKIKNVTRGKNAGDVIELSADEKVPLALQEGMISHEDHKDKYSVYTRDIEVKSLNFVMKGAPLKGAWQNNLYTAEGEVTVRKLDIHKNYYLEPKRVKFLIKFEDKLDKEGLPDLKVTSLVLS